LDPDVQEKLLPELAPGEFLIWGDWADQGLIWRESDWPRLLPGLIFTIAAIFFTYGAVTGPHPVPPIFKYLFLPLVLIIGLYFLIGHQYFDMWKRSYTVYGLTQTRVLIVCTFFYRKVLMVDLTFPRDISLHKRANNRGTIFFGREFSLEEGGPLYIRKGVFLPIPGIVIVENPRRLELSEDASRVYDMIRERLNVTMKKYDLDPLT